MTAFIVQELRVVQSPDAAITDPIGDVRRLALLGLGTPPAEHQYVFSLNLSVFRPGNGSPSATNVVRLVGTKAFSFHNRSSLNFAHALLTMFSRIAPCRIFKLSPI